MQSSKTRQPEPQLQASAVLAYPSARKGPENFWQDMEKSR
jgi:hypothetical protein